VIPIFYDDKELDFKLKRVSAVLLPGGDGDYY